MVAINHVDGVHDLTFVGRDANRIYDMKSFELSATIFSDSSTSLLVLTFSPKSMLSSNVPCYDSTLNVQVTGGEVGCSYLASNPSYCSYSGAGSHFHVTCNQCATYKCSDSELEFVFGDNSYKCLALAMVSQSERDKYCSLEQVYSTYRASCKVCG